MHYTFWLSHCPTNMVDALWKYNESVLHHCYNQYQSTGKLIREKKKLKNVLVKYGLWNLVKGDVTDPSDDSANNIRKTKRTVDKFVDLAVTQDASVGIAQNFLTKFTHKLIDDNSRVSLSVKEKFEPIIVRDINANIRKLRNDKKRITKQAFLKRNHHMSNRQRLDSRKSVSCVYFVSSAKTLLCTDRLYDNNNSVCYIQM